jgi:hypothetical protein
VGKDHSLKRLEREPWKKSWEWRVYWPQPSPKSRQPSHRPAPRQNTRCLC